MTTALYKKKSVSIEYCAECAFPNRKCFSANLAKGQYSLCPNVKIREMIKEWTCKECGAKLGITDTPHRIPTAPTEELKKLKQACQGEVLRLKTKVGIKVLCDQCFNKLPGTTKALELFGFV